MSRMRRRTLLGGGVVAGVVLAAAALRACSLPANEFAPPALPGINVVPRAGWGAQPRVVLSRIEAGDYNSAINRSGWRVYDQPLDQVLRLLVVHHSALPASDGPREIQRLHQQQRGFADVGYHFMIDARGVIFEGRPVNVRGAHVGGHNTGAVGVCLLGNFERIEPTPAQLASLSSLGNRAARCIRHHASRRPPRPAIAEHAVPGRDPVAASAGAGRKLFA